MNSKERELLGVLSRSIANVYEGSMLLLGPVTKVADELQAVANRLDNYSEVSETALHASTIFKQLLGPAYHFVEVLTTAVECANIILRKVEKDFRGHNL